MIDAIHFLFILFTGLCLGSFASLIAYRWPRGLPWTATRSQCPACGHTLGARDLIPLVSYVLAGGVCRYCQTNISVRYPILEIIAAALCMALYILIGWNWLLIPAMIAVPLAMALVIMQLERSAR